MDALCADFISLWTCNNAFDKNHSMSADAKRPIHILLADDQEIVRAGLRAVLAAFHGFQVVGEAASADDAVREAQRLKPDVVLLDYRMPGGGTNACQQIKQCLPGVKVLFLTAYGEEDVVMAAVKSTADGFLLKDVRGQELAAAIESVYRGKAVLDAAVTRQVLERIKSPSGSDSTSKLDLLSAQEKRVIALVAQGLTNKEIALELGLSDKTIKNYLANAMEKLGVSRRSQAAAVYVEHSVGKSKAL